MRIVVVLVLTAALAWAFLKLFPSPTNAAAPSDTATISVVTDTAPPALPPAPTLAQQPPRAAETVQPPAPAALAGPFHPTNPFAPTAKPDVIPAEELGVAASLAAGRFQEVERALDGGAFRAVPERAAWLRTAVEALSGRRERALERAKQVPTEGRVSEREVALVRIALGLGAFPPQAPARAPTPVELGLDMALHAAAASAAQAEARHADAVRSWSRLLQGELGAPWEARADVLANWSEALEAAQNHHRWSPRGDWPSFDVAVQGGDSLVAVRVRALEQRPGLHLSTGLIERANGLRSAVIHPGQVLRIPTDPVRVEVHVAARWLLYFHGDEVVGAWPVGVGRSGSETITGDFVVGTKQKNPTWFPRGRAPVPFGDPENPLGTRWLAWRVPGESADTSYGFHGTNEPGSIGRAESEGCIRMLDRRAEELFEILPVGAPVRVR